MARRRFQRGSLALRGKEQKWVAKWREDVIEPDGTVRRVQKKKVLGTLKEYGTRRLAARALEKQLSDVNSLHYRARPTASFKQFIERWERDVLTQHKRSTGSSDRSRIRKHLLPYLGGIAMSDITTQVLQEMVAKKRGVLSEKSVRNLVATLRIAWTQAKSWGYADHNPCDGLVLPESGVVEERFLLLEEMMRIIKTAPEPYKTFYWILAESGIRSGEACGLPARNLLLDLGAIKVTQKVWPGNIETVKSVKGNRICEISPQLVDHLRGFLRTWRPNPLGLLFATRNGTPWDADVVRKRKFYPLLEKLGIERCGFHAFRHGNETVMDQDNVPMAVRQGRLGHSDAKTTMRYSHALSEDGKQFAARLGNRLAPQTVVMSMGTA